jgi:4-amino-4-deoxy-L-arabinose transferase-like glycosyltransferase
MKQGLDRALVLILLGFFAGAAILSMRHKSATVDEFAHLPAGYYYWLTRDFSLYAKNPPLVKMIASAPLLIFHPSAKRDQIGLRKDAWRPWDYGTRFMRANWSRYKMLIFIGRLPVIFLSILLGLLVYLFSRWLYGKKAGLLSLFCFCLSPNILAHARLATVDAGSSLFLFAATFALFKFLRNPGPLWALLAGLCLGLAQLSKFTALFWIIFFVLFTLVAGFWPRRLNSGRRGISKSWPDYLGYLIVILFITWLVTCAGYGFKGLFRPTSSYTFYSAPMKEIQAIFAGLPAPLPEIYLQGLDAQILDSEKGEFSNYLLGQWYRGRSLYYFLVALIFKVPLALQVGFLIALFSFRRIPEGSEGRDSGSRHRWTVLPEEAGLVFIMLSISALFSAGSSLQIGIRYLVPLFPFAFVLIGRLAVIPWFERPRFRVLLFALGLWLFASNLFIYPDYLAYFNELCLGPRNGHKILLDSNLDWGQDLQGLARYIKKKGIGKIHLAYFGHVDPALYGIDYDLPARPPVHEYTAISANLLLGFKGFRYPLTYHDPPGIIKSEFLEPYLGQKPVSRVGYSIFIFKNPGAMSRAGGVH